MALFIEMVRTALYRRNEVGVQAPAEPCVRCGKPVLPQGAARLELLVGGEILPVGDSRSGSAASQGSFPIGPDCARALGSKYVIPYLKELPEDASQRDGVTARLRLIEDIGAAVDRFLEVSQDTICGQRDWIDALQARVTTLEAALRNHNCGSGGIAGHGVWCSEHTQYHCAAIDQALAPGAGGRA